MFTGNMVTEAIPPRVFALYRIVDTKKSIQRSELQAMIEPPELREDDQSTYFAAVLKAAVELKLVDNKDNVILLRNPEEQIKTMDDFRRHVISVLPSFESEQFWRCSNVIVNMNDKIFEYNSISDSNMLTYLSKQVGQTITAPMIRGWRFWAQFLGFGYMNEFAFLPNAYLYVKNVLLLSNLERGEEYGVEEFITCFSKYGKMMLPLSAGDRKLNISMSSALRELHDNGEIVLKTGSDREANWSLFPSKEFFNQPISSIVFKGVQL